MARDRRLVHGLALAGLHGPLLLAGGIVLAARALGPMSTPVIDIYMAAVLFPFYTLPLVMKPVVRFVLTRSQSLSAEAA